MESIDKVERILGIYSKLMNGSIVNKTEEANRYGVNERSIQRDIDDIRNHLSEDGATNTIVYDRIAKGYCLERIYDYKFTNPEVLAICKILLDSRAFTKREMQNMLKKLVDTCVPEDDKKLIQEMIRNEEYHYIEPRHGKVYINTMWDIAQAIRESRYIEIKYQGIQGSTVKTRKLKPLGITFSEMYFYLTAFIDDEKVRENFNVIDDSFPTIYRVDRIQGYKILDEHYQIPYADRFEEGEFRKRIQFMMGGKIRRVQFKYFGYSIEAVLDRLPTAKIIAEEPHEDGKRTVYTISAEVYGDGIDMWMRSQGDAVKYL